MLTFAAAILVYKQMVLPFFDYLDILIDSGLKLHIDKLQQLQFRGNQDNIPIPCAWTKNYV